MILDPLHFVPTETNRHRAAAEALAGLPRRRRSRRRGVALRLASWATGRTVHA